MFRRSQGFIIDFNVSEKMYNTNDKNISPAMARSNGKRLAKNDWQRFLLTMSFYAGVFLDLYNFGDDPKEDLRKILVNIALALYIFSPKFI